MKQAKKGMRLVAVVGLLLALAFAVDQGWMNLIQSGDDVKALIHDKGWLGYLQFFGLCIAFKAVGGPRQLVALAMGFVNGAALGAIYALLTSALALTITYHVAHTLLRPIVLSKFEKRALRFSNWMAHGTTRKVLLVRLLPVGSNLITNLVAGATHIHYWKFLSGSVMGFIPQTVIFALIGSGIGFGESDQLLISAVMLVFAAGLGFHLYRTLPKSAEI